MPRTASPKERAYVEKRLEPILRRLRDDRALRDRFLAFASAHGGDLTLMVQRLQSSWWPSRRAQLTPFFVLTLCEFESVARNASMKRPASRRAGTSP